MSAFPFCPYSGHRSTTLRSSAIRCSKAAWIRQAEASPFVADQIKTGVSLVHWSVFSRSR